MGTPQNHDFSRKRVREVDHGNGLLEFEDLGGPTSKRRAFGQGVVFRMIVPSKLIGRVIGKEGSRIRQIREETGATIKIADPIVVSSVIFYYNVGMSLLLYEILSFPS